MDETNQVKLYSRRDLGKIALAALPAAALLGRSRDLLAFQAKPNSNWGGVPFGIFAPYRFGPEATNLEGALKALVNFGVSNTEISAGTVETYLGIPQAAPRAGGAGAAGGRGAAAAGGAAAGAAAGAAGAAGGARAAGAAPAPGQIPCTNGVPNPVARGAGAAGGGGGRGGAAQTPEQQAAAAAAASASSKWRTSVPMAKFAEVKKKFNDAGVNIYAYRFTLTLAQSDAEYDYAFNAAKALCTANPQVTMEKPSDMTLAKRIGDAAVKHGVNVGYHLHTTANMTAWDDVMALSPRNGIQLDVGHYVAGTGISPVPFIEKHHAHIFSMHLKDRKKVCHDNSENMPWGQGDTPLKDILQTLKKNKWAIPAGIEFEYNVPEGSTWDKEIAKCVQYAKDALLS